MFTFTENLLSICAEALAKVKEVEVKVGSLDQTCKMSKIEISAETLEVMKLITSIANCIQKCST